LTCPRHEAPGNSLLPRSKPDRYRSGQRADVTALEDVGLETKFYQSDFFVAIISCFGVRDDKLKLSVNSLSGQPNVRKLVAAKEGGSFKPHQWWHEPCMG
jgi:hypothetical protein